MSGRNTFDTVDGDDHDKKGELGHHEHVIDKTVMKESLESKLKGNMPNGWGKGHRRLYMACAVVYLMSTMNGYDGSLMGSINALPAYQKYYNLPENGAASTGIIFSIFQIGQMAGALFTALSDYWGRRPTLVLGAIGVVIGAVVTATAKNIPTFVGGRFLLSFFATIANTAAPILLMEIAPPQYRGTVAGVSNSLWYLGSIVATFTVYGTQIHQGGSNLAFRLPLWLQMVMPAMSGIGIYMLVPESPKWLYAKGRVEQVRAFYTRYHANGDATHPIIDLEMTELAESLARQGMVGWRDTIDLTTFTRTRARRYRTGICIAMSWFGQFSGNNVASYYLPIFLGLIGITNTNTQLLLNAIYAVVGMVFAATGARFHDIFGRRKMLLGSTMAMTICLTVVTGTAAAQVKYNNTTAGTAAIAFIFLFGASFAFGFTPMQPVYPGEVLSNDMRAKGMALFQLTGGCASFVNTFAAPIALKNIGYWFYFFFAIWDIFEAAIIYFFFVETKGRTLEELDWCFEQPNPVRASLETTKVKEVVEGDA